MLVASRSSNPCPSSSPKTMFTYFRGWKRKAGLVTLVTAFVLMAGWIRGRSIRGEITIGTNERDAEPKYTNQMNMEGNGWFGSKVIAKAYYQIVSTDGITIRRIKVTNPEWSLGLPVGMRETSYDAFKSLNEYIWRRQLCGFDFGERRDDLKFENVTIVGSDKESVARNNPQLRMTYLSIPYWAIVLPLTLLSAWLLLSKGRQPTQPEPSQERAA